MRPRSETEVAQAVTAYLRDLGWECYFEVSLGTQSIRANIVAVQSPLLWVVETKTTLSLDVLGQAMNWEHYANYVSVAAPWTRNSYSPVIAGRLGVGVLFDRGERIGERVIEERVAPTLHRRISGSLRGRLAPEHKTWCEPGSQSGGHYTPFAATVRAIHSALRAKPDGMTMRELVASITHHYATDSTARSTLPKWIRSGYIKNVRVDETRRPARWFYCEAEA